MYYYYNILFLCVHMWCGIPTRHSVSIIILYNFIIPWLSYETMLMRPNRFWYSFWLPCIKWSSYYFKLKMRMSRRNVGDWNIILCSSSTSKNLSRVVYVYEDRSAANIYYFRWRTLVKSYLLHDFVEGVGETFIYKYKYAWTLYSRTIHAPNSVVTTNPSPR